MKKNALIFIVTSFILIASLFYVNASASTNTVCCEKTTGEAWCQNTEVGSCNPSFGIIDNSCAQSSFCRLGTCVDVNQGVCTENVGKSQCEARVGVWYDQDINEIPFCKPGCCKIGNEVAFVSKTECGKISSSYGVPINFYSSITDEATCLSIANSDELGACVYSKETIDCKMLTKKDCSSSGGIFNKGILCTANELNTDCVPTKKTECYNNDVYFLDSCNNRANIYNNSMESYKEDTADYWTYLYKDKDYERTGNLSGDCNYALGTKCVSEKGINSCQNLSCNVTLGGKVVTKQHGESWCSETNGTLHHILVNPITMEWENETQLNLLLSNYNQYNVPGSRYVREYCWEGEVIIEPCADYRNEICKEAIIDYNGQNRTVSQCRANSWRQCLDITDKDLCEDPFLDCTWVPGYRFDMAEVNWEDREYQQGSCVPLFAPGFDFWNPETNGNEICSLGAVSEKILYEVNLWEKRYELDEDLKLATENCYDSCYAIPGYGSDINSTILKEIHLGESDFNGESNTISDRLGYYCEDKTGGANTVSGLFSGGGLFGEINCVSIDNQPLYYTNDEWLKSITKRASLLGDCGYKTSSTGQNGTSSSEIITSIIQKLTQDGDVKKNVTHTRTIYINGTWDPEKDPRTIELNKTKTFT